MSQKLSTFIKDAREQEGWLPALAELEGADSREAMEELAAAALLRGTLEAIPVPPEAEERSRLMALNEMRKLEFERTKDDGDPSGQWREKLTDTVRDLWKRGRRE